MRRLLSIVAIAFATQVRGADLTPIAPLIDAHTMIVARADVARIDADAWLSLIAPLMLDSDETKGMVRKTANAWLADFRKKGGRDVYVVFGLADVTNSPCFIVPVAGDLERKDLAELLMMVINEPDAGHARIGKLLCVGPKAALERLKARTPVERPDLAEAFAAAGDGILQVAMTLPADLRRVLDETLTDLPPEIGGGPVKALSRGFKWLALSLEGPPKLRLSGMVQAADADAAARLNVIAGKLIDAARAAPGPDGDDPLSKVYPKLVKRFTELLTPKVDRERLVIAADFGPELPELVKLTQAVPASADRARSVNNLKQLAIAIHNFHDVYGYMPTDVRDKDGKPLLSWRVLILPYIEQEPLYQQFKLNEPWDSEHNKKLIAQMPRILRSPRQAAALKDKTTYLAPTGKGMIWDEPVKVEKRAADGTRSVFWKGTEFKEIHDGTSNTILIVEADDDAAVTWTKPEDYQIDPKDPGKKLWAHYTDGFNSAFADGSVRFMLKKKYKPEQLYWFFTRSGNEVVPE